MNTKVNVGVFIANHKYVSYCEAVVYPDGMIEYAYPSHIEKLISIYMEKSGKNREIISQEILSSKLYANPIEFLVEKTGCVSVWYNCVYIPESYNKLQHDTLEQLQGAGAINIPNLLPANNY